MSKRIPESDKHKVRTAILVDGGFYKKMATRLFGKKSPKGRADELEKYCYAHLRDNYEKRYLYRIFYYDCPPSDKNIHNPLTGKTEALKKSDLYKWMFAFHDELRHRRKFALRLGKLQDTQLYYQISHEATKKLLNGSLQPKDLQQSDLNLNMVQKGVDMRIGIDISSLAFKKQVNQIILISGDSDFVPAAKQARREGIDFILDPMGAKVSPDLYEHIDGIRTPKMRENRSNS